MEITDPTHRIIERAVADRLGLWGNHGYEAVYAQAFNDITGKPLDGNNTYSIVFDEKPPVEAFGPSLCMTSPGTPWRQPDQPVLPGSPHRRDSLRRERVPDHDRGECRTHRRRELATRAGRPVPARLPALHPRPHGPRRQLPIPRNHRPHPSLMPVSSAGLAQAQIQRASSTSTGHDRLDLVFGALLLFAA